MWYWPGPHAMLLPKPEPRKRSKAREARLERAIIKIVRADVEKRDGYCRAGRDALGAACSGESQWAHYGDYRRFKTRGMSPLRRHCTEGSLMLCQRHHDQYDGRQTPRLYIEGVDANQPLIFRWANV